MLDEFPNSPGTSCLVRFPFPSHANPEGQAARVGVDRVLGGGHLCWWTTLGSPPSRRPPARPECPLIPFSRRSPKPARRTRACGRSYPSRRATRRGGPSLLPPPLLGPADPAPNAVTAATPG
jgi:hypothetical protein